MGKWIYWSDVVVIPVLVGLMSRWQWVGWSYVPLLLAGLGAWTLMEYGIHRGLHHPRLIRYHLPHHREPEAGSALGTFSSIGAGLFVFLLSYLWPPIVAFIQGLMLGYVWFVIVHATTHHRSMSASLTEAHLIHHRDGSSNFGVTTTFWDRLLGTFTQVDRDRTRHVA
jgi:sterol desaturase/sphingolipid hydroxylase (fatty acid hydroxylase superfamily)